MNQSKIERTKNLTAVGRYIILMNYKSALIEVTEGGLEVPPAAQEEKEPNRAIVLAVGNLVNKDECPVEVGDKVIYRSSSPDGGLPAIMIDGEVLPVCYPDNIVAIEQKNALVV